MSFVFSSIGCIALAIGFLRISPSERTAIFLASASGIFLTMGELVHLGITVLGQPPGEEMEKIELALLLLGCARAPVFVAILRHASLVHVTFDKVDVLTSTDTYANKCTGFKIEPRHRDDAIPVLLRFG